LCWCQWCDEGGGACGVQGLQTGEVGDLSLRGGPGASPLPNHHSQSPLQRPQLDQLLHLQYQKSISKLNIATYNLFIINESSRLKNVFLYKIILKTQSPKHGYDRNKNQLNILHAVNIINISLYSLNDTITGNTC
jgi:hypothetical protein